MEFRNFGRTGVKVSSLCLGCMNFGGRTGEEDSFAIIDRFLDRGLNFLDTANVYNKGASEEIVGKALKRNGKRERVFLATKVHGKMDDDDPNMSGNHARHIIQQCEASLKRLQTEWIDLYQIHRPRSDTPIDETLKALDKLVRDGKVRYLGTSTFHAWQVMEALSVSWMRGLARFVCEQPPYHPLDRRIERGLVPLAQTYGLAIIPWSPLAGGFLTGKYRRDGDGPSEGRLGKRQGARADRIFSDASFDILDVLEQMAGDKDCTVSQLALAWNAAQPGITSPIIGPRTMEQLEDNLGALNVDFTKEDSALVDEVARPGEMVVPYYEADFGPHQHGVW